MSRSSTTATSVSAGEGCQQCGLGMRSNGPGRRPVCLTGVDVRRSPQLLDSVSPVFLSIFSRHRLASCGSSKVLPGEWEGEVERRGMSTPSCMNPGSTGHGFQVLGAEQQPSDHPPGSQTHSNHCGSSGGGGGGGQACTSKVRTLTGSGWRWAQSSPRSGRSLGKGAEKDP